MTGKWILRCLLSIEAVLLCGLLLAATPEGWVMGPPEGGKTTYAVHVAFPAADLTGVCVVKDMGDAIRGTLVNEFGAKVLDFSLRPDRRRVKLLSVASFLQAGPVRRGIRRDLTRLFSARESELGQEKGHKKIAVLEDGTVELINGRWKASYAFREIL